MPSVNMPQIIKDAREELKTRVATRIQTEKRIGELRLILRTLVRFVTDETERQEIMHEVEEAKATPPSLTDSISDLLQGSEAGLTSNEIRERLEQSGFDLADYSQPLAAIMTSLGRLIDQEKVTRYLARSKSGGTAAAVMFKWVGIRVTVSEPPKPPDGYIPMNTPADKWNKKK